MASKFTAGESIATTRKITPARRVAAEPPARNHAGLRRDNTMTGMPGPERTGLGAGYGGAKGGSGAGPHREGPIGKRGSSGAKSMDHAAKARGTMAGRLESLKGRAKTRSEGSRRRSLMY